MPRLFTGIPIPSAAAKTLLALVPDSPGLRPVPAGNLHLTLHFLGSVAETQAVTLAAALADIPTPQVSVQLSAGGMFGHKTGSGVLWVGLASSSAVDVLRSLQQQQRSVIERLGLRCEDREWQPHVTVARFQNPDQHLLQQFQNNCRHLSLSTELQSCVLWESQPTLGTSTYLERQRYPFHPQLQ